MGRSMQEVLIFDSFLKHTKDSIVVKEYCATEKGGFEGGKIICASESKAKNHGLNRDTIRGKTDFDLLPPKEAEKALKDDLWVLANREALEDLRETITHPNDDVVRVSVTKFPWITPGGELVGVMCIARNITIREKAKEQAVDLACFIKMKILVPLEAVYSVFERKDSLKDNKILKVIKSLIDGINTKLEIIEFVDQK